MKKSILIFVLLSALVSSSIPAHATFEDEQWPFPNTYQAGHHSVMLVESADWIQDFSYLQIENDRGRFLCTSMSDPKCATGEMARFQALLPQCATPSDTDCIEGISANLPDGKIVNATFSKYIYGGSHPNKYAGDGIQIPANPSEPSLWNIPGAEHAFGAEYVIAVGLAGGAKAGGTTRNISDFYIRLSPVSELPTANSVKDVNGYSNYPYCQEITRAGAKPTTGCGSGAQEYGQYRCAFKMIESATCLLQHAFPVGVRFKVAIRMKSEPNGMFHGRLDNPAITVDTTQSGTRITVEAGSVKVPSLYYGDYWNNLSQELKDYWTNCLALGTCRWGSRNAQNPIDSPEQRNLYEIPDSFGDHAMSLIGTYAKYVKDTSIAAPSLWSMKLLSADQMGNANQCFKTKQGFLGVVNTNSTTYSAGPPTFQDGFLNYKVASLHYLPNSDVFKGTYSLILRSDVARCIYGFSSAPVSASVQVLSADGSNQVATTVVDEKKNYLYLMAEGFTFSSPTIKVKLSQKEATPVPTPTASPSPMHSSASSMPKSSLTCAKGKVKKKISGVSPKCPTGYKKVA
jgi:hypothetical protein